jgi:hypothetical protein
MMATTSIQGLGAVTGIWIVENMEYIIHLGPVYDARL